MQALNVRRLMLNLTLAIFLSFATNAAVAQQLTWAKSYGSTSDEAAWSIQQTQDGGYIVAGETGSFGAGEYDFWVLKLDSSGNIQWQKAYGGTDEEYATSIQQTKDGGYIVAGGTSSFGAGWCNFWVLKLDSSGNIQWQKTYGGADPECAWSIQQTQDGGYIVAGWTRSFGAGEADFWVLKLDSQGNPQWQKTYGGVYVECAFSIQQTQDGGYIVAGRTDSFKWNHDADPYWDWWVLKLDSKGDIVWQKSIDGLYHDALYFIQQTKDGGYIAAGSTGSIGWQHPGPYGVWVLKINSQGNIVWQKAYGSAMGDAGCSIQQTQDGGYIVAGETCSFGAGCYDFWVLKLDSQGNCGTLGKDTNAIASNTSAVVKDTAAIVSDRQAIVTNTNASVTDTNAIVDTQVEPSGGLPTVSITKTVNFQLDAGLLAGIYGEVGIGLSKYGLKGAHAAVASKAAKGLEYSISKPSSCYQLLITRTYALGATAGVDVGSADLGVVSATALSAGVEFGRTKDLYYFFNDPLNNRQQAAVALSLTLADAATTGGALFPGVGEFVSTLLDIYSNWLGGSYWDAIGISGNASLSAEMGQVSIGFRVENKKKSASLGVSDAVLSGNLALSGTLIAKTHPPSAGDDWAVRQQGEVAIGGRMHIPFVAAKEVQGTLRLGVDMDDSQSPIRFYYEATADNSTGFPFYQTHSIDAYRVEIAPSLARKVAGELAKSSIDRMLSGSILLEPVWLINDLKNVDGKISQLAGDGEAVYEKSVQQAKEASLGFSFDIGGSIGAGFGITIGFDAQSILSTAWKTETGKLFNGSTIADTLYQPSPSDYEDVIGISRFFWQLTDRVLGLSGLIGKLKDAFRYFKERFKEGVQKIINFATGKARVIIYWVKGKQAEGEELDAHLTSYELKLPVLKARGIGFATYTSPKVKVFYRGASIPGQLFTGIGYAYNVRISDTLGNFVEPFPQDAVKLEITITAQEVEAAGFQAADLNRLSIFWHNPTDNTWYEQPTTRNLTKPPSVLLRATITMPGDYAAGLAELPPDKTPPVIKFVVPPEGSITSTALPAVGCVLSDERGLIDLPSTQLLIDDAPIDPVITEYEDGTALLAIPAAALSAGAHRVKITTKDAAGNTTAQEINFQVELGQPGIGLQMLSLPFIPVLAQAHEIFQSEAAKFGLYKDGSYQKYPEDVPTIPLVQGQGLWAKFANPLQLKPLGRPCPPNVPAHISLATGWNIIGAPFNTALSWNLDAVKVKYSNEEKTLKEAQALGWIEDYAWGWKQDENDPNKGEYVFVYDPNYINLPAGVGYLDKLDPWKGYWVKAKTDCELILPPPTKSGESERLKVKSENANHDSRATIHDSRATKDNWQVQLIALAGGVKDSFNVFGVTNKEQRARSIEQGVKIESPPRALSEGYVDLYFVDTDNSSPLTPHSSLAIDLRPPLSGKSVWRFVVETDIPNADVAITWPNLSTSVPKNYKLTLIDEQTGRRKYMRTTSAYTFKSGETGAIRNFRIEVEPSGWQPLRVYDIIAVPNRAEGTISISYKLSAEASVDIKILSLTGKPIRTLSLGQLNRAGINSAVWNLRDNFGMLVPNGIYLCQINATTEEGQAAKGVRTIIVMK